MDNKNIIENLENINIIKKGRGRPRKENIDKKQYYQTFKKKYPDIITEKKNCDICCGSYTYFTQSTHNKTKKHKDILALRNNFINKIKQANDFDLEAILNQNH